MRWYFAVLEKYAVFRGRARRKEFWDFFLINWLLATVAIAALEISTESSISSGASLALAVVAALYAALVLIPALAALLRADLASGWPEIPLLPLISIVLAALVISRGTSASLEVDLRLIAVLYIAAVLVPGLAVSVRRLHDTDRSGWWPLFGFVPLVGAVVLIIFYAQSGQPGENWYGPDPKADTNLVGRGQAAVACWPSTSGPLGLGTVAHAHGLASSAGEPLA